MARLGTTPSPTGRDRAHEELGVRRANFLALLERRGIQDYDRFIEELDDLNERIQRLRGGDPADLISRGGVEVARQDMVRFFDQFIDRVQANPQGIHTIAQAINPAIDIQAFNRSPAREFGRQPSQVTIQELRSGNGPFDALRVAVEGSQNTDLFVLFSLYSAARAALERAVNPREARENEAQLQGLERERTFLMRVNDEIAGVHEAFDTQETRASIRTWGSRASSAFIGSVATYIAALTVSGHEAPDTSMAAAPAVAPAPTSVTVNVNMRNTITFGHIATRNPDGSYTINPSAPDKATIIDDVTFQLNGVHAEKDGSITGKIKYAIAGTSELKELQVKAGSNTLSNGKALQLGETTDGRLKATYNGTDVIY